MRTCSAFAACALAATITATAANLVACASDSTPAKATETADPRANGSKRDASMTAKSTDDSDRARDPAHDPAREPCAVARKAIETHDFGGWRGLPNCSADQLFDDFPTDTSELPARRLGSTMSSATFVMLNLAGYYRPMANIRDDKLVLVDGVNPEIGDKLKALLTELGEPEAKLDWTYGTLPFAAREWVYPKRGITLFLNTDHDKALHVALYAVTDLETYKKSLRPPLAKKRLPKK